MKKKNHRTWKKKQLKIKNEENLGNNQKQKFSFQNWYLFLCHGEYFIAKGEKRPSSNSMLYVELWIYFLLVNNTVSAVHIYSLLFLFW